MARRKPLYERMLAAITEGDRRYLPELRGYCAGFGLGLGLLLGYLLGGVIWMPVAGLALGAAAYYALPILLHLGIWALGWTAILSGVALFGALIWWGWRVCCAG